MPIIKSAKKRVRTAEKAAIRNSKTKRTLRTALKSFRSAVTGGSKNVAADHAAAQSNVDKAAKKGLIHKNKAARQKSQLARAAKAAGAATTGGSTKKVATKPAASKSAAPKKAAAPKKPAAKAPTKKPAAKKTTKK